MRSKGNDETIKDNTIKCRTNQVIGFGVALQRLNAAAFRR